MTTTRTEGRSLTPFCNHHTMLETPKQASCSQRGAMMTFGERIRELREVKGDSHQIWRTQRVQGNVASLRLFLRFSTGPSHAFEPQSLGRVRDPVRIAEGPTHDFGFSILDFGLLDCGLKQHESHCRKRCAGRAAERKGPPPLWYLGNVDGPLMSSKASRCRTTRYFMEPGRVDAGHGSRQTPIREGRPDHLQASRQWIREQRRGLPLPRSMPGALRGVTRPRMRTSRMTYAPNKFVHVGRK